MIKIGLGWLSVISPTVLSDKSYRITSLPQLSEIKGMSEIDISLTAWSNANAAHIDPNV